MLLFFNQNAQDASGHQTVLANLVGKEHIHFNNELTGKENVIIYNNAADLVAHAPRQPHSHHVLMTDHIHSLTPQEILSWSKSGLDHIVDASDIPQLVDVIQQTIGEKKKFTAYIDYKEDLYQSKLEGNKIQLDGLRNNHIIGDSPAIKKVLEAMRSFTEFKEDILVLGENGVGKDVFVNTLIENLPTNQVGILNLGETNPQLLASELFGYKKGAFTGADKDTEGMFSAYNKGVIYLDEIGELPQESQAVLLRALQNREYRPVGSTQVKKFEGQIIAATNKDLQQAVSEGKFRIDLFNRLKKLVIYIPPLRNRKEDIPLLVDSFLADLNKKYPSKAKTINVKTMTFLQYLDWPGNIRELQNFVFRAFVQEPSQELTMATAIKVLEGEKTREIKQPKPNLVLYEESKKEQSLPTI